MQYLWIFLGGGLGSMARFALSQYLPPAQGWPWGTLAANLAACFLLGLLGAYFEQKGGPTAYKLLLATGFCGGFSTFSTFGQELFQLLRAQAHAMALGYLLASVILGILAMALGYYSLAKGF